MHLILSVWVFLLFYSSCQRTFSRSIINSFTLIISCVFDALESEFIYIKINWSACMRWWSFFFHYFHLMLSVTVFTLNFVNSATLIDCNMGLNSSDLMIKLRFLDILNQFCWESRMINLSCILSYSERLFRTF